ncbi:MAG: PAS domain S-box protein [Anaerolineae bacterium]
MEEKMDAARKLERCEQELRASEARFQNIIGRNVDGILIVDREGIIRFANPVAGTLFGRGAETLAGEDFGFPVMAGEKTEIDLINKAGELITADMWVTETHWEGKPCYLISLRDITERKQVAERIAHLNNVLRALRNVAQIIVREKDRDRLLRGVCETLVEARGYYNAWILLLDEEGNPLTTAEAGLEERFPNVLERWEAGRSIHCIRQSLEQPGALVIENPAQTCADCPLAGSYEERGAMSVRLEHSDEVYGVLTVSTPRAFITDEEEHQLFEGMAGDLALALRNMTLERRREELERIVNRSPAVAFLWRAEEGWPIDYVSDNVEQFGYTPEDLYTGRIRFSDIIHPDDVERVTREVGRTEHSQARQFTQEYRIQDASGDIHWVDDRTWIRRDARGRITHYEGVILDITERKRAEAELRRSARLNKQLLDGLPHPAMLVRRDRIILTANRAAEEIGARVGDYCWRGFGHCEFLPEEDRQYLEEHDGEPPPGGTSCTFCLADGVLEAGQPDNHPELVMHDRTWDVWWVPISDETYLHYAIDITERKQMERALRHSQQRYHTLFEHASDAIFVHNLEGHFVDVNRIACERLRYSREELLQMTPMDIAHPEDAAGTRGRIEKLKVVGHIVFEATLLKSDGTPVPFEISSRYIEYDGRPAILSTARDISERKEAEEKIARYAADLERSNEDLERFGYIISHDLQEPLRMVSSYLGLLKRRYEGELDEKADMFIDYAVDGAQRMREMIKALLNLSRVETQGQAFLPTDIEEVVEHTLQSLERTIAEAGGKVTHDPLPTVMADRAQLAQVFQNLIANALKFRREDVTPHVHISAEREDDVWRFSITDNGIGIDPRQADRIFQIFQRLHTRDEYPGMGIGLALCRRIVERHGGHIWVESEPGEGTTFSFTIPLQKEGS